MRLYAVGAAILFAGSAVAAPATDALEQVRSVKRDMSASFQVSDDKATNETDIFLDMKKTRNYPSRNWAGAVVSKTDITEVTGTFNVPFPKSNGHGSAWVGLDGHTCRSGLLQVGITWHHSEKGTTYDAWFEWAPGQSYRFNPKLISISGGDVITAIVKSTSQTSGYAILENKTTGQTVSHHYTGQYNHPLCNYNAEWIVEDYRHNGEWVEFANFDYVQFSHASAIQDGTRIGVEDAVTLNIWMHWWTWAYTNVQLQPPNSLLITHT